MANNIKNMWLIEETCELHNTKQEAEQAIQEYYELGIYKEITDFHIIPYQVDRTPVKQEPEVDLVDQLKAEGFNMKEIEMVLMYVECGHGLDSAMQNVIMEMEG